MILADGQSVVWASRMLRVPLPERVAGIDLFLELLAEADRGGTASTSSGRGQTSRPDAGRGRPAVPGPAVAGARDGYFQPDEEPEVAAEIRRSGADLLFIGMSSPKKELFLSQWGEATGARVVHGVGGSFDVLAGVTRRAPALVPEAWPRMALPRAAGTTPARPPVPDHQLVVHRPGRRRGAAPPETAPDARRRNLPCLRRPRQSTRRQEATGMTKPSSWSAWAMSACRLPYAPPRPVTGSSATTSTSAG